MMVQKKQLTRRQKAIRDTMLPVVALFVIIASSTLMTLLITEPLIHPNRHPTLCRFAHYLEHHHPRLSKVLVMSPFVFLIGLQFTAALTPALIVKRANKRKLIGTRASSSSRYLNCPFTRRVQFDGEQAWKNLAVVWPGMPVDVPGIRPTNWRLVERDERGQKVIMRLTYCHDVIGGQSGQMHPRTIYSVATIQGKSLRSDLSVVYSAVSAMDYATVKAIIDQTNSSLEEALRDESAIDSMSALDAQIRSYKDGHEKKDGSLTQSDGNKAPTHAEALNVESDHESYGDLIDQAGWIPLEISEAVPGYSFYKSA